MEFRLSDGADVDIAKMGKLIFDHGPNQWNYLPEEGVARELADVRLGRAQAVLCEHNAHLTGLAIFYPSFVRFPDQVADNANPLKVAYIGDVVVHKDHASKGIGSNLLRMAIAELQRAGMEQVFIDCHEENLASRGMIRKAGFHELVFFNDPERRFVGSQRTCICILELAARSIL